MPVASAHEAFGPAPAGRRPVQGASRNLHHAPSERTTEDPILQQAIEIRRFAVAIFGVGYSGGEEPMGAGTFPGRCSRVSDKKAPTQEPTAAKIT